MPAVAQPKKLTAKQVTAWADALVQLEQARARVSELDKQCKELLERYEPLMEASSDPDDADKDVKVAEAGGWRVRVSRYQGSESFSLKDYKVAGHEVTPQMAECIKPGGLRTKVTTKRLAGRTRPGAVETFR